MYKSKAEQCLKDGQRVEARKYFNNCLEVTQEMKNEVEKVKRNQDSS